MEPESVEYRIKAYTECIDDYEEVPKSPEDYPDCVKLFKDIAGLSEDEKEKVFDTFMKVKYGEKRNEFYKSCDNEETFVTAQNVKWVPPNNLYLIEEDGKNFCFTLEELQGLVKIPIPLNPITRQKLPPETVERIRKIEKLEIRPSKSIEQVVEEVEYIDILTTKQPEIIKKEEKINQIEALYGITNPYITVEQYINTDPRFMAHLPESFKINKTIPYRVELATIQDNLEKLVEDEEILVSSGEERGDVIAKLNTIRGQIFGLREEKKELHQKISEITNQKCGPLIDYLYSMRYITPVGITFSWPYLLMLSASLMRQIYVVDSEERTNLNAQIQIISGIVERDPITSNYFHYHGHYFGDELMQRNDIEALENRARLWKILLTYATRYYTGIENIKIPITPCGESYWVFFARNPGYVVSFVGRLLRQDLELNEFNLIEAEIREKNINKYRQENSSFADSWSGVVVPYHYSGENVEISSESLEDIKNEWEAQVEPLTLKYKNLNFLEPNSPTFLPKYIPLDVFQFKMFYHDKRAKETAIILVVHDNMQILDAIRTALVLEADMIRILLDIKQKRFTFNIPEEVEDKAIY